MSVIKNPSATPGTFSPIQADSLVASVHRQIRGAILSGSIGGGEEIKDSVLASQMQVSRAPVREALRLLQQSGLVEKASHKPYRVKSFDEQDLRELVVLRIAIETTAARLIVAQNLDVSDVKVAVDHMREAWEQRSETELDAADWEFHRAVVHAAAIERLNIRYADLIDQMILVWRLQSQHIPRSFVNSEDDHEHLLSTLRACTASGDSTLIQQELIDHIKFGMGCPDLLI